MTASPGERTPARRGRRPGNEDTRGLILAAARTEFARRGYSATTLRGIARAAGVDARLVHHYFDGKRDVFVASIGVPANLTDAVAAIAGAGPDGVGERMVTTFLQLWDRDVVRDRLVAVISAAMVDPPTARTIREFVTIEVFGAVIDRLGTGERDRRAALAVSQMIGLAMARFVLEIEPIASQTHAQLVADLGPTLQRYLTGPLADT